MATFWQVAKSLKEAGDVGPAALQNMFLHHIYHIQTAIMSNGPDMTKLFHERSYGRFKEISMRIKKLYRTNQGFSFFAGSFNNRDKPKPNPI